MQPSSRHITSSIERRLSVGRLRARRGVSLVIVAVTLSVVAVMAAVTMPNLVTYQKQKDAELTAVTFLSLDSSLIQSGAWLNQFGSYPQRLKAFVVPLVAGDPKCGSGTFKKATGWAANAPYTGVTIIPDYGVPTPLGFIHDSVLDNAVRSGEAELHLDSLDLDAVQMLDIAVDGTVGPTAGTLRYAASTGSTAAHPLYLARYTISDFACP